MWTKPEITAVKIAQRACGWNKEQYELLLRNVAGVHEVNGRTSSTNPSNTHAGFVRFMAFAERTGFTDNKNGPGFWTRKMADETAAMKNKINAMMEDAIKDGLLHKGCGAIPAFIQRMTAQRPAEEGGQTMSLAELDWLWTYKILEGLKAWLRRERSRARSVSEDVPPPSSEF
jgi:hypothetical protein